MVFKYFLLAFVALISQCVYCIEYTAYLNCDEAGDIYDICECNMRKYTQYLSDDKVCNYFYSAIQAVLDNCVNISYCRDAYGWNDDFCPKAKFNYGTTSCRAACLQDVQRSLDRFVSPMCFYSNLEPHGWICNSAGWENHNLVGCDYWRMDVKDKRHQPKK